LENHTNRRILLQHDFGIGKPIQATTRNIFFVTLGSNIAYIS